MIRSARTHLTRSWLALAWLVACGDSEPQLRVPEPDAAAFASTAYPILLRDCGFPACHGDHGRFFQVFGPGRTRLSSSTMPYDPPTSEEVMLSYTRARSMLAGENGPARALLLRKPLAPEAGGAEHEGDDAWGQPVYASPEDPRFRALRDWALLPAQTGGSAP